MISPICNSISEIYFVGNDTLEIVTSPSSTGSIIAVAENLDFPLFQLTFVSVVIADNASGLSAT